MSAEGHKFEGGWCGDELHGEGMYTDVDGSTYAGVWEHGEAIGAGTMTRADGTQVFVVFD